MPRRILFVASEVAPLIKVGGLADVVGALPGALAALGVEARILIPKYGTITKEQLPVTSSVLRASVPWQGRQVAVEVVESVLPTTKTVLYLLDAPEFFQGGGIYYDRGEQRGAQLAMERFVFFSWAISRLVQKLPWQPELIHCHDWHTAAVPTFLNLVKRAARPTVLTIHNIEGQGKWHADDIFGWLGLRGDEVPALRFRDHQGNFNLLQQGIRSASMVNTVSPTYAHEIVSPVLGMGLEKDLVERRGGVSGILNGLDFRLNNPFTDPRIHVKYDAPTATPGKLKNKQAALAGCGLKTGAGPLFVLISRLTGQKGVDLVPASIPAIAKDDGRLLILGTGVPAVERAVVEAAAPFPEHVRVMVKFDALLAQQLYAAADFFLMPSRFEPCGLGQLVAMRYGALPIVRDTGGLHDTVRDLRRYRDGTGLVFGPPTPEALLTAVQDALRIFRQPDTMVSARARAMNQDFSWGPSAKDYLSLYSHAK